MRDFLTFARRMIRDRALIVLALLCALMSAVGMGVGILSVIPAVRILLDGSEDRSLVTLAQEFNRAGHALLGIAIEVPAGLIARLPTDPMGGVIAIVVLIAGLTVIGATFNFLHQYLSITVAARTIAGARLAVFERAMLMPLVRVSGRGASEFVARIIGDSAAVQRGLIALTSKGVAHSSQAVVLFVVAIFVGRSLTIAALLVLPVLIVVIRKLGKRIRRAHRGALERQEDLLRVATESVQGLRAVKANTAERHAISQFDQINRAVVREELRARVARAFASPLSEAIAVLAIGFLVIFAAREILGGRLTVDLFVIALGALAVAGSKLKLLAGLITEMQAASAPARRLLDVLAEPREEAALNASGAAARRVLPRLAEQLVFDDVTYTYPQAASPAIRAVSLSIEHGERVAVVGPNGCGKTTLLSLVPRLLVPDSGRVLFDGVDVATATLRSLRDQISVVTQETVLFRGSIEANIRFGNGVATHTQLVDAARRAHALEFIQQLPLGFEADIAEQGQSLSGGQRQRIAIARAILRDPVVLILDEATSQIDAESEAHIGSAINEFADGRTVLIIAHRLATVLDADRIVVMEAGRVVDQGTHSELLERCALYGRLSATQLITA